MKKDEMNELVKRYEPLMKKEASRFASSQITYDELMSEAYYIMAWAIKRKRHRLKGFPSYIKKSLHLGLLRYVIRERKRREYVEYR